MELIVRSIRIKDGDSRTMKTRLRRSKSAYVSRGEQEGYLLSMLYCNTSSTLLSKLKLKRQAAR